MSGMIERVARALCEDHIRTVRFWDTLPKRLDEMIPLSVDLNWRDFVEQAITAIKAMREPTIEMLSDGRDAYLRTRRHGVSGMTIDAQIRNESVREGAAYRAMIDAALQEPSQ